MYSLYITTIHLLNMYYNCIKMNTFKIFKYIYVNIIIYHTIIVRKIIEGQLKLSYDFIFVLVIFTYTIAQSIITTHND